MKIAVISPNTQGLEAIGQILRGTGSTHKLSLIHGGMSRLSTLAEHERPDVLVIDGMGGTAEELVPLEYLTQHAPQTVVLMLCSNQSPEVLINAMRAGVREVLPSPPTQAALQAALARAEAKLGTAARPRQAQVLAFIACKGGSGATFLATNLGFQLASDGKRVLVVDCNLQFGDAVLFTHDRKPATNLADVARNIERLDAAFLASSVVQVTPDFAVLAAPEDPGQALEVKPEHIDALINVARTSYDFVILDVGRILDAVTLRGLDKAQLIFPVLQTTLPFIRDASRLLTVFRSLGYAPEKIRLLVNRHEKSGDFTLDDIKRTLGGHAMRTIPNSYAAVAASINHGTPIARMAAGNAVAKSLADFARSLLPAEEVASSTWIGRLLKRA